MIKISSLGNVAGITFIFLSGGVTYLIANPGKASGAQDVIYRSGMDVPDPAKVGNPDATVARAHELLALLKTSNWQLNKGFPIEKLIVDDQRYAESPGDRKGHTSFGIPRSQPPYEDIAIICDTYVRKNIVARRNGSNSHSPSGFFIVGFKDGRVEKIPVSQVRTKEYAMEGASTRRIGLVFPGAKDYDSSLPPFQ